jgi:hypothetical protein
MAIGRIPEPGTGIPESIVDAKGDIVTATAADTPARLAVGTTEHRLVAASGEATGLKYVADTTNYAVAAKGDLLVGTAADTLAALTVGANGTTLVADSSEATGLKWAAPGGGKIVQVISTSTTTPTSGTSSYVDSGITATITPTSASNKILVFTTVALESSRSSSTNTTTNVQLRRGSTTIANYDTRQWNYASSFASGTNYMGTVSTLTYMDSPATTSATTYTIRGQGPEATSAFTFQPNNGPSSMVLMEIGA